MMPCVPSHDDASSFPLHSTRLSMAPMRSASLFGVAQLRVGSKLVGLKGMLGSVPYIAPEIVKKQPYNEKVCVCCGSKVVWLFGYTGCFDVCMCMGVPNVHYTVQALLHSTCSTPTTHTLHPYTHRLTCLRLA